MRRRIEGRLDDPVFAFAGIGQPQRFFEGLKEGGWNVVSEASFPDHRRYSAADLARLSRDAERAGARVLVTTEKDAARLDGPRALSLPLVAVSLTVTVEPAAAYTAMLARASGVEAS
jgi:tetraacyldisaccharide 4'-kinase